MTREDHLQIAKKAYKEIMQVITYWEETSPYKLVMCWDECIWSGDYFFSASELVD